jgi:Fe2+ transport system protein FeoA
VSKAPKPEPSPDEPCAFGEVCPLNQVEAGCSVRIKRLEASPEVSHRLREMGFCEDQQVRIVRQDDAVICQVCHARLGISSELASRILVQQVGSRPVTGKKAA